MIDVLLLDDWLLVLLTELLLPVFAAAMMGVGDAPEVPTAEGVAGALLGVEVTPPDAPEGPPGTPPTMMETGGFRSSRRSSAS